jgi:GNAT superfamily N-acetyltransferase
MFVRSIELSDVEAITELVKLHIAETNPHMCVEEDVVRYYAEMGADPQSTYKIFIAENDSGMVGYLVAHAAPYMYCREYSAGMEAIFVHPSSRGSKAAMMLIRAYDEWATNVIKAKEIYVGVNHGMNTNRAERFFAHMGFKPTGSFFRKVRSDD